MHVSCWTTILHHLQVIHTPKANLFIYECSSHAYIDSIYVIHCFGSPLLKIGSTKGLIGVSVDRPSTPNFVISVRCKELWWLIHQRANRQLFRRNLESGFDRRIRNSEEFIDDLRSEQVHGIPDVHIVSTTITMFNVTKIGIKLLHDLKASTSVTGQGDWLPSPSTCVRY